MNEEKRRRRRWLNLAEFVAIAGLLLAAFGAWSGWSERRDAAAEKRAAASASRALARLDLRATVDGDRVLLTDPSRELQDVKIVFPKSLGVPDRHAVAVPAIERDWFGPALLKATDGGADHREGRLPVLVTATWLDGDARRTSSAIVDLAWRTDGRRVLGRSLAIEAARLRTRRGSRAEIDALWTRELAATAR